MDFAVFVLLNAVLLLRPEELLPDIAGLRLYLIVISLSVLTAGPRLLNALRPSELAAQPITLCVLGVWVAGILSQVFRGQVGLATDFAGEFGKVVLYYLLLVAVIDTPARLRAFLGCIVVFVVALTSLALLQYHAVIDLDALRPLERRSNFDPDSGEWGVLLQLRSTGIYNDPNDLCLILVTGLLCTLYRATTESGWVSRFFWLLPAGVFGYAVFLTQSRGGFLGLLAALFVLACVRLGPRWGLLLALAGIPVALAAVGGRQAEMNLDAGDTAQQRLQVWAEGMSLLWRNPITGIGSGEFAAEVGLVAHNSFVQGYVEMGFLGGTFFVGAFFLAAVGALRSSRYPEFSGQPVWSQMLRPFVVALVVGYAAGTYSLSRNYVIPTYMILGLAAAYIRLALPHPPREYRLTWAMVRRLAFVSLAVFAFLKVFTQSLVIW